MTTPIYIPIPNVKKIDKTHQYLSKTYPPSPTNSPKTITNLKRIVLYGTPFKNKDTVKMLLKDCIEDLNDEQIKQIVYKSEYNKHTGITIIRTYDEKKAFRYCQNLVENGLDATIE